jgi:hypothetical protein
MKNFKLLTKTAIVGYILLANVFISCVDNKKQVEITSKIVEQKVDYSKMPSYCNPNAYKILKVPKGYIVQLPRGTVDCDYYDTPEECQKDINERASRSKQRWIDSGGADF